MLLKKISLNNIRSYENAEVEFTPGSTLLSGDIGSGKTSILLAIEFALFGLQPGQRGNSLLRNGEQTGGVKINFEVDGRDVLVERTLKRGKTVSQDYCAITLEGEKSEISVTELKNRVLELLKYPKEFSKKQNILYKFTVYTPQEEMKQIILQDPETRINTLRHVFGIDKYKKVLENVSTLTSKLREEKRLKEGMTANLEQSKQEVILKEQELESKRAKLVLFEDELKIKISQRKDIEIQKQDISLKIDEKRKLEQEIEKTKLMISNKKESVLENIKLANQIKQDIDKLSETDFEESKISKLGLEIASLRNERQRLEDKKLKLTTEISSLNMKNLENEKTREKIKKLDLCPTCLQDVDPVYKTNVVNNFDANTTSNNKKISELQEENKKTIEDLAKINSGIIEKERKVGDLKILKIKFEGIQEKRLMLAQTEKTNLSLEKDIGILEKHKGFLETSIFELKKFETLFEAKQRELDEAFLQERKAEIGLAELRKEIDLFSRQISELKLKIEKIKQIKSQLDYIVRLENWLSKNFATLISVIEKNVMIKLKAEFSSLFTKWFSMLVSDTFDVRLSDNFTPVIEQQDYEIDYAYLSGGERTAIALAYRLSLNQVINSLMSKIKTRDLVILDEPTDGFSDQQLDKMREVLEQLNIGQLIIVSHEQKIEGFVENVLRFGKENGISRKI